MIFDPSFYVHSTSICWFTFYWIFLYFVQVRTFFMISFYTPFKIFSILFTRRKSCWLLFAQSEKCVLYYSCTVHLSFGFVHGTRRHVLIHSSCCNYDIIIHFSYSQSFRILTLVLFYCLCPFISFLSSNSFFFFSPLLSFLHLISFF